MTTSIPNQLYLARFVLLMCLAACDDPRLHVGHVQPDAGPYDSSTPSNSGTERPTFRAHGPCEELRAATLEPKPSSPCSVALDWTHEVTASEPSTFQVTRIDSDAADNVYVLYTFEGTVAIGGTIHGSPQTRSTLLTSYAPDGAVRWTQHVGSVGEESGADGLVVGGDLVCTVLSHQRVVTQLTTLDPDVAGLHMVRCFDRAGQTRWARALNGVVFRVASMQMDSAGNLYVAVSFADDLTVASGQSRDDHNQLGEIGTSGDVAVFSYAADGSFRWLQSFGGAGSDEALNMTLVDDDLLVLAGSYKQAFELAGTPLPEPDGTAVPGFLLALDNSGDPVWVTPIDTLAWSVLHPPALAPIGDDGILVMRHASSSSVLKVGRDGQLLEEIEWPRLDSADEAVAATHGGNALLWMGQNRHHEGWSPLVVQTDLDLVPSTATQYPAPAVPAYSQLMFPSAFDLSPAGTVYAAGPQLVGFDVETLVVMRLRIAD